MLVMFVDGGCRNWGDKVGSYCALLVECEKEQILSTEKHGELIYGIKSVCEAVTNNITELLAVIKGLEYCQKRDMKKLDFIVTDSKYVERGINVWHYQWEKQNWNCSNGPVKNVALWKELVKLWYPQKEQGCNVIHTRGHSGVWWNEVCDQQCSELMS